MTIWTAAWAVISIITIALHLGVRQRDGGGAEGPIADALVPVANAVHLASVPVRSSLRKAGLADDLSPLDMSIVSASAGWCIIIAALAGANEARRVLVHRLAAVRTDAPKDARTFDPTRRRFLINAGCGVAALGATSAGAKAAMVDPRDLVIRRYTVPIRGLPSAFDGLRIVQVSDTHLGPAVSAAHVRRAVQLALRQNPDLVVLTGDYIEAGNSYIQQAAELFAPLTARGGPRLGVLGVLGNHDYYGDASMLRSALERIGIRMIDNDRTFLIARTMSWSTEPPPHARDESPSPVVVGAGALCFAGLGDLDEDAADTRRAFRHVPSSTPRILLCHQPDTVELSHMRRERIDLALCGHTHGGQIALPFIGAPVVPSQFGQKYVGGLVRGPGGPVIVSRGVGMSILPVRWNVPPEVVVVTLRAAPDGRRG